MVNIPKIRAPSEWSTATLGGVAKNMLSGGTPSTKNTAYWKGTIPWITSKWLNDRLYLRSGEKFISQDAIENSAAKIVPSGNLIFATRVGVGKVAVNDINLAINQDLAGIVIDKQQTMPEFLAYQLRTGPIQQFVEQNKRGATIKGITKSCLSEIALLLPPLPEQRKIAAVLSLVQRAAEQQECLIALTTELKKALMHKLFTEGTRDEAQEQTEIGSIPESWEVVELQTTGEVVYGIQASVANNYEPIGTRILTNKNITLDGGFDLEKINYFELRTKRHYQTLLRTGDLLFNWRSGSKEHVGKTAYFDLEGQYTHSSFILRIRPNDSVNGRFLYHFFNWLRESGYFIKLQTYAVNAKFNKSAVNVLPTAKPSLEEQNDIAAAIDTVIELGNGWKRKRDTTTSLFRTLLHQLMTGEIRVNDLDLAELGIEVSEEQAEAI